MDKPTIINLIITIVPIVTILLVVIFMESKGFKPTIHSTENPTRNKTPEEPTELQDQIDLFIPLDDNKKFLQEQNPLHIIFDDEDD